MVIVLGQYEKRRIRKGKIVNFQALPMLQLRWATIFSHKSLQLGRTDLANWFPHDDKMILYDTI